MLLIRRSCIVACAALLLPLAAKAGAASGSPARYAPPPPAATVPTPGTGMLLGFTGDLTGRGQDMPPGIVNGPCQPKPAHPYPVVLVHGTFANEEFTWQTLAPLLADAGYCVFGLNYGASEVGTYTGGNVFATDYIARSAAQLQKFIVSTVLPNTFEPRGNAARYRAGSHPKKVDIVGHSQGGMMPRYLIDSTGDARYPGLGHAAEVHTLIGLAPSNQGTTFFGAATAEPALLHALGHDSYYDDVTFGGRCGACGDQITGSPFIQALNRRPDAKGVAFYVIESAHDEVVTPYTNAFLPASENAVNVTLQDQCATDHTEHLGIVYDPVALTDVMAALARNGTVARPLPQPACPLLVAPVLSG